VIFLDTSVYVAASLQSHQMHRPCFDLLRNLRSNRTATGCGVHSLSELYSVLTRIPPPNRLPPSDAFAIVDRIAANTKLFSLRPNEQMDVIRDVAARKLVSGIVHDAGLMGCARKARAEAIYTLNPRHFSLAAPDLAGRIRLP
jgi:predicted nucleic acid-binding protein